ncbi:MAG: GNAT family N-acetyltransferase [Gammaproteobacteria bacterium]|nr:GNAT family N-acetyltransferase [Gammaproteobacteria bacterium]
MSVEIERGYAPGAIGRITELHGTFYQQHTGFGLYFESKVACELSEFLRRYDSNRDGIWLARTHGSIEGSLVIDSVDAATAGAHLRWFIASDTLRGTGVGNRLMRAALDFCRLRNYIKIYLWTFEGLNAARHLYEKYGFRLVQQQRGNQWGAEVNEQRFECRLAQ